MPYPIIYLASAVTSNSTTTAVTYDGDNERADIYFTGTFNGASVNIQASPLNDGSASGFVNISGATAITDNTVKSLSIGKDTKLRAVISSAGASTSLTIYARYYKE
jgi:outer membrane receptor for Fe3+-dicitrate